MRAASDLTVAEAVGAALAEAGVDQVFGVLGSGNFAVTRAMKRHGVGWVPARHEGGAVVMADVYSRLTGTVAACSVHQGPGFTNCITGLTEAAKARTPLLVLAADTADSAVKSNFRVDQAAIAAAVGALHVRLEWPEMAVVDALRAHRLAISERRPVVLSMPLDVQAAVASEPHVSVAPLLIAPPNPTTVQLATAAAFVAAAEKPLVIAGRGAARAASRGPIEEFAEAAGALVATSAAAHGLFAGSPWSLGLSGGFASPTFAGLIRDADVVISFGCSLNMWTTRHGRLLSPDAIVIQVDLEPAAFLDRKPPVLGLVGDVVAVAEALTAELAKLPSRAPKWRVSALAERLEKGGWSHEPLVDETANGHIDPRTLSILLDRILPAERTLAIDSGHFMGWPAMYMGVPDVSGFVFTQAFQSIGLGLAGAIGAAVARPDRLTIAAVGDGGLLMGISELETAVRLGLSLLVVCYNDAAYGAEVHHFGPQGMPVDIVRFPETDIAAMGRGAGAQGVTVRSPEDLDAVRSWVEAGAHGVFVIDAKVVPTVVGEWLPEAFGH